MKEKLEDMERRLLFIQASLIRERIHLDTLIDDTRKMHDTILSIK